MSLGLHSDFKQSNLKNVSAFSKLKWFDNDNHYEYISVKNDTKSTIEKHTKEFKNLANQNITLISNKPAKAKFANCSQNANVGDLMIFYIFRQKRKDETEANMPSSNTSLSAKNYLINPDGYPVSKSFVDKYFELRNKYDKAVKSEKINGIFDDKSLDINIDELSDFNELSMSIEKLENKLVELRKEKMQYMDMIRDTKRTNKMLETLKELYEKKEIVISDIIDNNEIVIKTNLYKIIVDNFNSAFAPSISMEEFNKYQLLVNAKNDDIKKLQEKIDNIKQVLNSSIDNWKIVFAKTCLQEYLYDSSGKNEYMNEILEMDTKFKELRKNMEKVNDEFDVECKNELNTLGITESGEGSGGEIWKIIRVLKYQKHTNFPIIYDGFSEVLNQKDLRNRIFDLISEKSSGQVILFYQVSDSEGDDFLSWVKENYPKVNLIHLTEDII